MTVSYLACPYSHPNPKVMERRYEIVTQAAFALVQQGRVVYSPITHNIPISKLGITGRWDTWKKFDLAMLSKCDLLIVLRLPGWEDSPGVQEEISYAKELGMPVEWIDPTQEWLALLETRSSPTAKEVVEKMFALYEERDWKQFHSPKNIAMNLGVEAGELMEHFRWLTEKGSFALSQKALAEIRDEIGDVFVALTHLSTLLGVDPAEAAYYKLDKMAAKYPVEKCKGLPHKYTEF